MGVMIEGVDLYPLRIIDVPKGNILHALRSYDEGFCGFGEAYFSSIECGEVKGWTRHTRMPLNIVVPHGAIRFVIYDDRPDSPTKGCFEDIVLSPADNYRRLYLEPGLWMAFMGVGEGTSLLLDIIPAPHDPGESEKKPLDAIPYNFKP